MENIINADYQVVQERTLPVIISEIKTIEAQVYKTAIDGAAEIGARLLEAKEQVGHGNWIAWCEENLNYTPRQAQNFIKIHENYRDENSPYANTKMSSHLSISKALALLQVPEDEVEKFAEENDIENMTVKKLESEIKKWKNRAASLDAYLEDIKKAHEKLQAQKEEKEAALAEKNEIIAHLDDELELMKESQADPDKITLLEKQLAAEQVAAEKAKEALEKEKEETEAKIQAAITEKKEALRKEAEQAQAEKIKATEAAVAERVKAVEESKQVLEEKLAETQKKLALSNNADITAVKIKMDLIQKTFMEVDIAIENIGLEDKEQESKLRDATKQILQSLIDRL